MQNYNLFRFCFHPRDEIHLPLDILEFCCIPTTDNSVTIICANDLKASLIHSDVSTTFPLHSRSSDHLGWSKARSIFLQHPEYTELTICPLKYSKWFKVTKSSVGNNLKTISSVLQPSSKQLRKAVSRNICCPDRDDRPWTTRLSIWHPRKGERFWYQIRQSFWRQMAIRCRLAVCNTPYLMRPYVILSHTWFQGHRWRPPFA